MKTNPGGHLSPSEVFGRDALIARLWRILERQSLVLSAERRMGKTSIIQKMEAEAPPDRLPLYSELEAVRTPFEFVETVFQKVEAHLPQFNQKAHRVRRFLAQLSGAEIGGVIKLPAVAAPQWKGLLTSTLADLVEHQERTVILLWDEMPYMLDSIKRHDGEQTAMEVLDTLRFLRQTHPDLRMVYTGSIGLHNVISSLKRAGYANDPTNDMQTMDVPPLAAPDAEELVRRLLEGEGIQADDLPATARGIADAVDGMPFFIQHVVSQMRDRGGVASAAIVQEILSACLTDPMDPWHLRYYRERLNTYYAADEIPFALNLLDALSTVDRPISFDDLFNRLKSRLTTDDSERARDVLTLLMRDHYVLQQTDGAYGFRFPLIQRYWRLCRGLTP